MYIKFSPDGGVLLIGHMLLIGIIWIEMRRWEAERNLWKVWDQTTKNTTFLAHNNQFLKFRMLIQSMYPTFNTCWMWNNHGNNAILSKGFFTAISSCWMLAFHYPNPSSVCPTFDMCKMSNKHGNHAMRVFFILQSASYLTVQGVKTHHASRLPYQ